MVIVNQKEYLSKEEFAKAIGKCVSTISNYEYRGLIKPDEVVGKRHFYLPAQVDKFLSGQVIPIKKVGD